MSSFTDFNGPQAGGLPNTKSLIDFTKAYQDMLSTLNAHINSDADENVHSIRTYMSSQLEAINDVLAAKAGNDTVAALATRVSDAENDLGTVNQGLAATNVAVSTISNKVTNLEATDTALESRVDTAENSINSQATRISKVEQQLTNKTFDSITVTEKADIETVETRLVKDVLTRINFDPNEDLLKLYLGSSGTGANTRYWHILGMLTDNAGVAFVKFTDTQNMAALINFAVSDSDTGVMVANVTRVEGEWLDTSFAICKATDADQNIRYYLCVAKEGLSQNQVLAFQPSVSGINFASPISADYVQPVSNGTANVVTQIDLGDYIISGHFTSNGSDGVPVGAGLRWPGNPAEIPVKYTLADGRTVTKIDYPELAAAWNISTETFVIPEETNTIIKVRS